MSSLHFIIIFLIVLVAILLVVGYDMLATIDSDTKELLELYEALDKAKRSDKFD